jgi:DNA polymerase-4
MRSVDEAAITLPPSQQDSLHAHFLAAQVKELVREKLGVAIRYSIGIAPNSLLAKLATDLQKPNGPVEITLESTPALLETLPLTALPGIAHANAGHLALNGITNPREFYDTPADTLRSIFGIWGQYWWWRLHGYEADGNQNAQRTISHEHVLTHWLHRRSEGEAILSTMAERLIHRLRRNGFSCQSLSVSISSLGSPQCTRASLRCPYRILPLVTTKLSYSLSKSS